MSDCPCEPTLPLIQNSDNLATVCAPDLVNCKSDGTNKTLSFAQDALANVDKYVVPDQCIGTLDLSTSECANSDAAYVASLMAETLNIAAGPVNLFPLLGVHNQGSTIDQAFDGYPLSSGTPAGFNAIDAFNINDGSWRSIQTGIEVLKNPAFIGYDFGTKKAWNLQGTPQERYQNPEPVRKHIQSFKLTQGSEKENRITQARIEASDDGLAWKRIDVVNIPDSSECSINIRQSAEYKMWRIVPLMFGGITANTAWEVNRLQLLEANTISLDNVQDQLLLENRDRAYCRTSILLKCQYDLLDVQTELSRFGINMPQTYIFTVSFAQMVKKLGRPVVVGDIVELPGEMQYDMNLNPVRKWLEITDTGWSTEGYTNNWKPNLFRFFGQPILPSIEHKDILGLPSVQKAAQSDDDFLAGNFLFNNQASETTEFIKQEAKSNVPQTGSDPSDILSAMNNYGDVGSYDGTDLYVNDAIPPDGKNYTIGDTLPNPSDIINGHYHRQTYLNIANKSLRPPERLIQWNSVSSRWSVVEINNRKTPESYKPTMSKILANSNSVDIDRQF